MPARSGEMDSRPSESNCQASPAARCWRVLVLTLVISPVFVLIAWQMVRLGNGDIPRFTAWVEKQGDVSLDVGAVRHPSPFALAGDQVTVRTSDRVRFLGTVERWRWGRQDGQMQVECQEAAINLRELPQWSKLLCQALLEGDDAAVASQRIAWRAQQLRLVDSDGTESLWDVRALVRPTASGRVASLTAMADPRSAQPAVQIQGEFQGDQLQVEIRAGSFPLPCSFLKRGRPWESILRDTSLWRGDVWITRSLDSTGTEFVAEVEPIDLRPLGGLLWASEDAELSGQAKAYVVQAQYVNEQLAALDLILTADHGTATGSALAEIAKLLQLQVSDAVTRDSTWKSQRFVFDQLRVRLVLRDGRLTVRAVPEAEGSAAADIVSQNGQPLLRLASGEVERPLPEVLRRIFD